MDQPLQGLRVIEFCNVAAGPYCGMLLADLGAEVIKVEHPDGGDTLRSWPPITRPEDGSAEGFSENFASLNRNKKSVCLDLKTEDGAAAARALLRDAQVLIENNRPGVMDRLGLGYERVKQANEAIVYCSISAYGQTGPRRGEGGFDLTVQAMSGLMSITGEAGRPPVKCGVPVADFTAGLYGAFCIAAAVRAAEHSGVGTHIDVPMLGATLAIAALQTSEFFGTGRDPVRLGSAHPRNAPYRAFQAKDEHFAMAAGNNALWRKVCDVVGLPALFDDPRFATTNLRARHQDELLPILEDVFATASVEEWLDRFRAAGVPCAPINTYSDALADPQVLHMGWVEDLRLPNGVETRSFGSPVRFSAYAPLATRPPPLLGQDTASVLEAVKGAV